MVRLTFVRQSRADAILLAENHAEPMEGLGPADAHLKFRGLSTDQNAYIVVLGLGELQLQPFALNETHSAGSSRLSRGAKE